MTKLLVTCAKLATDCLSRVCSGQVTWVCRCFSTEMGDSADQRCCAARDAIRAKARDSVTDDLITRDSLPERLHPSASRRGSAGPPQPDPWDLRGQCCMNGRRVSLWQPLTEGGAFRGLLDLVCASRLAHVDLYRKQPGPISSKARANVDS